MNIITENPNSSNPRNTEVTEATFIILRKEYVNLIDSVCPNLKKAIKFCAAKLINYFKNWTEWKIKKYRTNWIYQPLKVIYTDLLCEHSIHQIREAIATLIEVGLLERSRKNLVNGQEKTYQYKLNLEDSDLNLEDSTVESHTKNQYRESDPRNIEREQKKKIQPPTTKERTAVVDEVKTQESKVKSESLLEEKDPVEDKSSAPCITPVRKQNTNDPFWKNRGNNVQRRLYQLPEGEWLVDGKLDSNFHDWFAKKWMAKFEGQYKGDIYDARADVLAYFKNDFDRLPIRWQQYNEEFLHRYENTQTVMRSQEAAGLPVKIDEEYQQKLIANQRAITSPLSEDMQLTSKQPLPDRLPPSKEQKMLESSDKYLPIPRVEKTMFRFLKPIASEGEEKAEGAEGAEGAGGEIFHIASPASPASPAPSAFLSPNPNNWKDNIPSPNADNVDAYKPYVPPKLPDKSENYKSGDLRSMLKDLAQKRSMPQSEPIDREKQKLELLNEWLRDPILREEAIAKAMRSDRYTVQYDEYGEAIAIVPFDEKIF